MLLQWAVLLRPGGQAVPIHVYIHIHISIYLHIFAYLYTYMHIYLYTYTYLSIYTYMSIFIYLCMYIYISLFTYLYTSYIKTCIHIYIHVYLHVLQWCFRAAKGEPPTPKSVLKGEPPTPWRPHSVAPGLIQDLTVHEVSVENSLGRPRPKPLLFLVVCSRPKWRAGANW